LLAAGFSNWSKKDFFLFIRQCETYGRKDYDSIKLAFPTKTAEDVREYSEAFWKRWQSIENGQKYVERIEKGEQEIEKYRLITEAIEAKYKQTFRDHLIAHPEDEASFRTLSIDSISLPRILVDPKKALANPLFEFSDDEDRVYLHGLFRYGYGAWDLIRNEVRNSRRFRFNWIALSRTSDQI